VTSEVLARSTAIAAYVAVAGSAVVHAALAWVPSQASAAASAANGPLAGIGATNLLMHVQSVAAGAYLFRAGADRFIPVEAVEGYRAFAEATLVATKVPASGEETRRRRKLEGTSDHGVATQLESRAALVHRAMFWTVLTFFVVAIIRVALSLTQHLDSGTIMDYHTGEVVDSPDDTTPIATLFPRFEFAAAIALSPPCMLAACAYWSEGGGKSEAGGVTVFCAFMITLLPLVTSLILGMIAVLSRSRCAFHVLESAAPQASNPASPGLAFAEKIAGSPAPYTSGKLETMSPLRSAALAAQVQDNEALLAQNGLTKTHFFASDFGTAPDLVEFLLSSRVEGYWETSFGVDDVMNDPESQQATDKKPMRFVERFGFVFDSLRGPQPEHITEDCFDHRIFIPAVFFLRILACACCGAAGAADTGDGARAAAGAYLAFALHLVVVILLVAMQPLVTRRAMTFRFLSEVPLCIGYLCLGRHFDLEGFRDGEMSSSLNAAAIFHMISILTLVLYTVIETVRGVAVLMLEWRERVILDRLATRIQLTIKEQKAVSVADNAPFEQSDGRFAFGVYATPPAKPDTYGRQPTRGSFLGMGGGAGAGAGGGETETFQF